MEVPFYDFILDCTAQAIFWVHDDVFQILDLMYILAQSQPSWIDINQKALHKIESKELLWFCWSRAYS